MPDVTLRLDLSPSPCLALLGFLALALCVPGDSGSENTTLSASYPPPGGIYTKLISMGKTNLAQTGSPVIVGGGPGVTPGAGSGLIVLPPPGTTTANVGIGTLSPGDVLEVDVNGGGCPGSRCGVLLTGTDPGLKLGGSGSALGLGSSWGSGRGGSDVTLRSVGGKVLIGTPLTVDSSNRVGINNASPRGQLDVSGGDLYVHSLTINEYAGGAVGSGGGAGGGSPSCTGGQIWTCVGAVCSCQCATGQVWDGVNCGAPTGGVGSETCTGDTCNNCPAGATMNADGVTCACGGGATWTGLPTDTCVCAQSGLLPAAAWNPATPACTCSGLHQFYSAGYGCGCVAPYFNDGSGSCVGPLP